ncbi:hypothetical protein Smar_0592 [Staphylothermus marinus F1]|uniref:Ferritin-like domain-containing protein n=1 Tax=Staphylothermus marinus (strain ATCC 43588 / DSM 3639 / JCM 9404 / F1) TaxID=399550 RepID=A3DM39_STAMF|nr:hypothetical protein [Staphylothermus marinus]ABN69699.1 hypothetical protein Smar_0592 [Staphylothermus marinus F1]
MSDNDILEFAKNLVKVEKEYAKRLEKTAKNAENLAVKAIIEAISMDSQKHSLLYKAIAEGLENIDYLTKPETEALLGEIEYHIQTEAEFIRELESKIKTCENESVKFILNSILKDEIYHHTLLRYIKEFIQRKVKALDENLWKIIWESIK